MTDVLLSIIALELAWVGWHVRWKVAAELEHICNALNGGAAAEPPDEA